MIFTKEVKGVIVVGVLGISAIVIRKMLVDVETNYANIVDGQLKESRDPSIVELENKVANLKTKVDSIKFKESNDIFEKVSEFKKNIKYNDRINELKNSVNEGVADYKESIKADEHINESKLKCDAAISNYKTEHCYDAKLKELKKKIEDAESEYAAKKAMCNEMPDKYKDEFKAFKKVAKAAKNEIVDSAKKDIQAIEDDFNTFRIQQETIRDSEISSINDDILSVKTTLENDVNKRIKDINEQVSDFKESFTKNVLSKRTFKEQTLIDEYDYCSKELSAIHQKESFERKQILKDATFSEKFAAYLKANGFKKWQIVTIGFIPVVAIEIYVYKYIFALFKFAKNFE